MRARCSDRFCQLGRRSNRLSETPEEASPRQGHPHENADQGRRRQSDPALVRSSGMLESDYRAAADCRRDQIVLRSLPGDRYSEFSQ